MGTMKLPWFTVCIIILTIFLSILALEKRRENRNLLAELDPVINQQGEKVAQLAKELRYYRKLQKRARNYSAYRRRKADDKVKLQKYLLSDAENELDILEQRIRKIKKNNVFLTYGYVRQKAYMVWRFLLYPFIHNSYLHLMLNVVILFFIGFALERQWNRLLFAGLFFSCGALAALFYVIHPSAATKPLAGTSAIITGMIGAYMVKTPAARIEFYYPNFSKSLLATIRLKAWVVFGSWVVLQMLYIMIARVSNKPAVILSHIGGILPGTLGVWFLTKKGLHEKYIKQTSEQEVKDTSAVDNLVNSARKRLEEGNKSDAVNILKTAITQDPEHLDAYALIVTCFEEVHPDSLDEFKKIIIKTIMLAAKKGDEEVCVATYYAYRHYFETKQLSLNTLLFLANILEHRNDKEEAIFFYGAAVKEYSSEPTASKAYYHLGRLYILKGDKDRARTVFKELQKRPDAKEWKTLIEKEDNQAGLELNGHA